MTITQSIHTNPEATRSEPRLDAPLDVPPLQSGDRLSRAEFERRYTAHQEIKKAELIEGVVYVASPVRGDLHGYPHACIVGWLIGYMTSTPGARVYDNSTVRLDNENVPQPDVLLRLNPDHGGRSRMSEDGYVEGTPELVVEVAASSASYDLGDKLRAYQRNGVQEYLVLEVYERQVKWFILREGAYARLTQDEAGILRSERFPGLWFKPEAFWAEDLPGLFTVLQQGLASPEHAEFVARLQASGSDSGSE